MEGLHCALGELGSCMFGYAAVRYHWVQGKVQDKNGVEVWCLLVSLLVQYSNAVML